MAEPRVLFLLDAKNLASKEFAKVQKDLTGVGASARASGGGIGSYVSALGGSRLAMIGVAGVIGGVVLGLKDAAAAAIADEESVNRLTASLKANVPGWDGNTDAIEANITAAQRLGFADEELRDSLTVLVGATKDVAKAQEIMATAQDLARFKGIDLRTASEALIKVEGGHYRALAQLGIKLREGATATEAMAAVQKVAAGQAEAFGDTAQGAMQSITIAVGELQEDIGRLLLPVIKDLAFWARDELVPAMQWFGATIGPVVSGIAGMDRGVRTLITSLVALKLGLGPIGWAIIGLEFAMGELNAQNERFANIERAMKAEAAGVTQAVRDQSAAMVELGKTPEAIAADLREGNNIATIVAAAKAVIQDPITAATKTAQKQAKAIAKATPFEIAKSLREGSDPVKVAAELLKDAIKNSLTPAKEIAALEASLTSEAFTKRLNSKRPEVVAAAQAYKTAIEERLFALRNGVPQIALDTGTVYAAAVQSKKDEIGRAAVTALSNARVAMKALQADATTWGFGTGDAYSQGIADGIKSNITGTGGIVWSVTKIRNIMEAGSPPGPESPLHKIDVWGLRTGEAWTEGMVGGIDAAAVRRAMAGVASETISGGASAFGQSVSAAARSGGVGPGGVPVSIPIYLDGRQIAEVVDEHLYYARAAAAR